METILTTASNLLTRHEIRVAVCGMQNSGKTVFLTSLADHLLHHDPQFNVEDDRRFDLGDLVVNDADIVDIHGPNDSIGNFDFRKYRAAFGRNEWPEKTGGTTELVIDFTLDNPKRVWRNPLGGGSSKHRAVRLRFLDIPGERLADFLMDGLDYAEWSDAILGNSRRHRTHLDGYGAELERMAENPDSIEDSSIEKTILDAYRAALDEACRSYDRFVSPSSFREPFGKEEKEKSKRLGREGMEFAPLSASFREKHPAIAKKFSKNYLQYRDRIVRPIVDWMRTADKALFLVDVFSCLNCGSQAYNGAKAETDAALDALSRKGIFDVTRLVITRIALPLPRENIRLLITKMDMADDCGRQNLNGLARQMFGKKVQSVTGFPKAEDALLLCAAVTTDEVKKGGSEIKKRIHKGIPDGESDKPGEGIPKRVPENLDEWVGRFPLKRLNPAWFNLRDDLPPKHSGLDKIACFVLGI